MHNVTLPPDLARFATDAVAAGRFRDVAEVVAAGVSLLQRQEQARAAFIQSRFWSIPALPLPPGLHGRD
jgi:putative addiction module CopG family antidote